MVSGSESLGGAPVGNGRCGEFPGKPLKSATKRIGTMSGLNLGAIVRIMTESNWLSVYRSLMARGVDTLTEEERGLRRLPIRDVKTEEALFQPRLGKGLDSGKHLAELKRALSVRGELDPISVMKIGGEWLCLDGHHRLEAYRQVSEGKRSRLTHVPVKVFSGSLDEALTLTIEANAPDKLNLSREEKLEAAWRMVVLGSLSLRRISQATTVALGTLSNMQKALQAIRERHPGVSVETWRWANVKRGLLEGELWEKKDSWQEAKAEEVAKELAKRFHGVPSSHPQVFALGLFKFDPEALKAIAEEGLRLLQRDQERRRHGNEPEGLPFVDVLPDDF